MTFTRPKPFYGAGTLDKLWLVLLYPYNSPLEWNSQVQMLHFYGIILGVILWLLQIGLWS